MKRIKYDKKELRVYLFKTDKMAKNKTAKISPKLFQILLGETIVTAVTITVTLAFIGSRPLIMVRNVVIFDMIFLLIYILWLKLFGNYEKFYKAGLQDE